MPRDTFAGSGDELGGNGSGSSESTSLIAWSDDFSDIDLAARYTGNLANFTVTGGVLTTVGAQAWRVLSPIGVKEGDYTHVVKYRRTIAGDAGSMGLIVSYFDNDNMALWLAGMEGASGYGTGWRRHAGVDNQPLGSTPFVTQAPQNSWRWLVVVSRAFGFYGTVYDADPFPATGVAPAPIAFGASQALVAPGHIKYLNAMNGGVGLLMETIAAGNIELDEYTIRR